MTDEICLYFHEGTADQIVFNALDGIVTIGKLRLPAPKYGWYEPRPESAIDSNVELPLQTFCHGFPRIPEGIRYSLLLLFYPDGSLTVRPQGKELGYVYWTEQKSEKGICFECRKQPPRPVCLRTATQLKDQYGVAVDDQDALFPRDDAGDGNSALRLIEYHRNGQRIAWTISTKDKEGGKKHG